MNPLSAVRQALRRRYRQWIDRRTQPESECYLNHRRLYILPSKAGFGFLALVGALWWLATNFENNLIFMLCFLLLALFVVSIHFTHGTLSGLRIKPVRAQSVFKGDAAAVELSFSQVRARCREQVLLRFAGGEPLMVTLEKAGDTFVTVLAPTTRRGFLDPGLLTVESVYPAGLLRVWTYIHFRFDAAVYPAPLSDRARTSDRRGSGEGHYSGTSGSEDYVGLKTFEAGESLRHVAWKQYAREQGLWSKQYGDPVDSRVWVDWDEYAGMDTEQRLSRMTWQVCECDAAGKVYGLRLPGTELSPNQGLAHRQSALRRLALFGIDDEGGAADETP
ncbi:MAG: DUF58 domain-containing protein [Xanthomonadales bacterium]|jgi:uncharacterized protein (DUF58 family)|nr:DUF58 domain-containing protein [Xanthomonadales bacterium]